MTQKIYDTSSIILSMLVIYLLSSGQTDHQVFAGGRKLNLRRDLHGVAKRTCKYLQVAKEKHFIQGILRFIGQ